ncbi:ABC transporter permease [Psychromicrobium sp. YIM B11713]|uniref:ABC transporter permease n=1 Tax=Psychromicrobium sp. YIM B11713 TaxID=3145233 RepID=UPI00374FC0A6
MSTLNNTDFQSRRVSALSRALSIAGAEAKITFRNKTVLTGALFLPLFFGAFYIFTGQGGDTPTLQVVLMLSLIPVMGVYLTATTTLATRREELFLKRLRSGEASNGAIFAGMLLPSIVMVLLQLVVILIAYFARGASLPHQPLLLVAATLLIVAMCAACGLFTSVYTPSAAAAQITVMPFLIVVLGTAIWTMALPGGDFRILQLVSPGGALATLVMQAWQTAPAWNDYVPAMAIMLLWTIVFAYYGAKKFRWDKR